MILYLVTQRINDRGYTEYYSRDKFITLEEFRQRKLNQLGI